MLTAFIDISTAVNIENDDRRRILPDNKLLRLSKCRKHFRSNINIYYLSVIFFRSCINNNTVIRLRDCYFFFIQSISRIDRSGLKEVRPAHLSIFYGSLRTNSVYETVNIYRSRGIDCLNERLVGIGSFKLYITVWLIICFRNYARIIAVKYFLGCLEINSLSSRIAESDIPVITFTAFIISDKEERSAFGVIHIDIIRYMFIIVCREIGLGMITLNYLIRYNTVVDRAAEDRGIVDRTCRIIKRSSVYLVLFACDGRICR